MSLWKVRKFRVMDEMTTFLAGGITGSSDISFFANSIKGNIGGAKEVPPLVGLTLLFTQPAVHTVTFAAGTDPQNRLLFTEVKSQIEAVMTTIIVRQFEGRIVFIEKTPSAGVTLLKTGTANSALGFDTNTDTVGKVYGTPFGSTPTAPYVGFGYPTADNMHVVWTFE